MAEYHLAQSLVALRNSINKAFPKRDKSSDGWIGDASHAARASEHNPCWSCTGYQYGIVRATDTDIDDNDPGRDLRKELLAATIGHPAVWYVISNGIIYSRTYNFSARKYNGSNAHTKHVHVSINKNERSAKDLTLVLKALGKPGGGSTSQPPAPDTRIEIHPSRIREAAAGNPIVTESNPAYDEVVALIRWFIRLTQYGGKPIVWAGGDETWKRAIRQDNYAAAGKYFKGLIATFQKRAGLVPDGVFGPKTAAVVAGNKTTFKVIGK